MKQKSKVKSLKHCHGPKYCGPKYFESESMEEWVLRLKAYNEEIIV